MMRVYRWCYLLVTPKKYPIFVNEQVDGVVSARWIVIRIDI